MSLLRCAAFLAFSAAVVATAQSPGGESRPGDAPRGGDARPQDSRPESAAGTDFAEEYKALAAEYRTAEGVFMKPVMAAKDGHATGVVLKDEDHPRHAFRPRFTALYERARGTPAGLDAALWLIRNSRFSAAGAVDAQFSAYSRVLDSAVEIYGGTADGLKLAKALSRSNWTTPGGPPETIRKLLAKVPAEARPGTAYALAQALTSNPAGTSDAARAEALVILKELAAEKGLQKALASAVADDLFTLEHLSVGAAAPDFTATDLDGVAFKLSDYRGKVVVLDFWGFW